jgi:serine/threonine protein kinase
MAPQPTTTDSQGGSTARTAPGGSLADQDTGPWQSVPERAPERDLIAAVVYYNSARQLFGAAAAQPTLGKYPLERVLGSGANGSVLLGRNPDTGGEVAIKILRPEVHSDPEREAMRLRREAHALAKLAHPNVVPIYDAGVADGALYIVMRRVSGATLRDAQGGRPWRQILDLYLDVARGLAAVHAAGLVHRDVKPDNVLLSDDGHVMLADFGLVCVAAAGGGHRSDASPRDLREDRPLSAQLSHAGEIHGTPAYMSPEALAGGPPAPAADLFALAAALYEALCGCLPYPGDTVFAVYAAASAGRLAPPPSDAGLPTWLYEQLKIALDPDPARRPATAEALIAALDYRPREARRRRRLFGLGAAAATLAGLAIGALAMRTPDPCERRDPLISAALHAQIGAEEPRFVALLRDYSAAWESADRQICRATFHDGAQAPSSLRPASTASIAAPASSAPCSIDTQKLSHRTFLKKMRTLRLRTILSITLQGPRVPTCSPPSPPWKTPRSAPTPPSRRRRAQPSVSPWAPY